MRPRVGTPIRLRFGYGLNDLLAKDPRSPHTAFRQSPANCTHKYTTVNNTTTSCGPPPFAPLPLVVALDWLDWADLDFQPAEEYRFVTAPKSPWLGPGSDKPFNSTTTEIPLG